MVPYDVLVDPVSMPNHPILDIKIANGEEIEEEDEEEDEEEAEEQNGKEEEKEEKKVRMDEGKMENNLIPVAASWWQKREANPVQIALWCPGGRSGKQILSG